MKEEYSMSKFGFSPIINVEDFNNINTDEAVSGYMLGIKGKSFEKNKSRSYYHGYLNGLNDGGFRKMDENQKKLVRKLKEETTFIEEMIDMIYIFTNEIEGKKCLH